MIAVKSKDAAEFSDMNGDNDDDGDDGDDFENEINEQSDPKKDYVGNVINKLQEETLAMYPTDEKELEVKSAGIIDADWDDDKEDDDKEENDDDKGLNAPLVREIRSKWEGFRQLLREKDDTFSGKTYPRQRRFEIFIDRRKNGNDNSDDNEKDKMLFFQPPKDCNSMPNNHLAELYFETVRKCLIPRVGYADGDDEEKHNGETINALQSVKFYVLSY